MNKVFINYADGKFYQSQKIGCEAALANGFNEIIPYGRNDIDDDFRTQHNHILSQRRGAGYWLWKPYLIVKTLEKINDGDYLCYCDAGSTFINNINYLIDSLEESGQDIMPFDLQQMMEKEWTKRDVFVYNKCDIPDVTDSNGCDASLQLIKKTKFTIEFYKECLLQSCMENLITDSNNIYGLPNYPEFKDHRHDQSIYSVNVKKNNLITFRTPSQWGNGFDSYYKFSKYPQIVYHHRSPL